MVKKDYLREPVEHIDVTRHNVVSLVDAMGAMSYSARDLARAAGIYDRMLRDGECGVILCLAGSLINAGLKKVFSGDDPQPHGGRGGQHGSQHRGPGLLRSSGVTAITSGWSG